MKARKRIQSPPSSQLLISQYGAVISGGIDRLAARFASAQKTLLNSLSTGNPHPFIPQVDLKFSFDVEAVAEKFISRASKHTMESFKTNMMAATGRRPDLSDQMRGNLTQSYVERNVSLIKSIPGDLHGQVNDIIHNAVTLGRRPESVARDIESRFGVAKSRAQFIARDQLSKLNGDLNRQNQQDIGVEFYVWRTTGDERVRDNPDDSHVNMEGMMCRWDDPTVFSDDEGVTWKQRSEISGPDLEPGEDYQCRCTAEAILPKIEDIPSEPESSGPGFLAAGAAVAAAMGMFRTAPSMDDEYQEDVQGYYDDAMSVIQRAHTPPPMPVHAELSTEEGSDYDAFWHRGAMTFSKESIDNNTPEYMAWTTAHEYAHALEDRYSALPAWGALVSSVLGTRYARGAIAARDASPEAESKASNSELVARAYTAYLTNTVRGTGWMKFEREPLKLPVAAGMKTISWIPTDLERITIAFNTFFKKVGLK